MADNLCDALTAMCEKYEQMNAINGDVRFGADLVLKKVREILYEHADEQERRELDAAMRRHPAGKKKGDPDAH